MHSLPRVLVGLLGLGLILSGLSAAPLRILYFSKSAGFVHGMVRRTGDQPSVSEKVLTELGAKHDLAFTFSKDGSRFSPEYLAGFDVIMFYTSGDLLAVGEDGQPALTPDGKQALLDAVAGGKGFVGVHSASDTFHTMESGGGNPKERGQRYEIHGDASDPYIRMLGGEFINHGAQQVAKARVTDPAFPGFEGLPPVIERQEEWYSLKEFAPDMHVLLVMETAGMKGPEYQRPSYPLAWARNYGKGRVWFNAMGHREDVWASEDYQAMLVGALEWAAGKKEAKLTPNLREVAPGAAVLPPRKAEGK